MHGKIRIELGFSFFSILLLFSFFHPKQKKNAQRNSQNQTRIESETTLDEKHRKFQVRVKNRISLFSTEIKCTIMTHRPKQKKNNHWVAPNCAKPEHKTIYRSRQIKQKKNCMSFYWSYWGPEISVCRTRDIIQNLHCIFFFILTSVCGVFFLSILFSLDSFTLSSSIQRNNHKLTFTFDIQPKNIIFYLTLRWTI